MFYHNINPVLFEIGPFEVRYYGLFYAIGFIIAYFLIYHLAKRKEINLTKDDVSDYLFYCFFGVILGARVIYVLFYNLPFYLKNPLEIIAVWHGGLSFHGGMVGVIIATILYCRKKKIHFYDIADLAVIPVALALALGRIGNFINGELYGRITNAGLCVDYSRNQFIEGIPEGCRHPSQIYESAKNLLIFSVLWIIKDKKLPKGFMFWSFIAMYGLLRALVEFFRQPDEQLGFLLGNFSMGQLLSFPLFILGIYMLFRIKRAG